MQHAGATTVPLPFEDVAQQREAASLGMWIFLGTEVLFFGGLIVCYIVYRFEYPAAFHVSSARLSIPVGAVMTVVLLLGSLLVALSDQLIHQEPVPRRTIVLQLGLTALLGVTFLGMEAWEYVELINHGLFPGASFDRSVVAEAPLDGRSAELFFVLFFCSTGLHGFHMIIGVCLVGTVTVLIHRAPDPARHRILLQNIGLYWHFVDIVWIFLFPMYYMVEGG